MSCSCTVIAVSRRQAQQAATILTLTKEQICCMLINFRGGRMPQMRMWLSKKTPPFFTLKTESLRTSVLIRSGQSNNVPFNMLLLIGFESSFQNF